MKAASVDALVLFTLLLTSLSVNATNFSLVTSTSPDPLIESFTKHGDFQSVKISPDGKSLAVKMKQEGVNYIVFMDVDSLKATATVRAKPGDDIYSYRWLNNDRIAYRLSQKVPGYDHPRSYGQVLAVNKDLTQRKLIYGLGIDPSSSRLGGSTRQGKNSKTVGKATLEIINFLADEEKYILVAEYPWSKKGSSYYDARNIPPIISKLNIYSGRRVKIEVLPFAGARPLANSEGEIKFLDYTDENAVTHIYHRVNKTQGWKLLSLEELEGESHLFGSSQDGRHVYIENDSSDGIGWFMLDAQDLSLSPLFSDLENPVVSWFADPASGIPAIALSEPDRFKYSYAGESEVTKQHAMLARVFEGKRVEFMNSSSSGNETVVAVSSDTIPTDFYIYYAKTKEVRYLMSRQSWIDPDKMQAKTEIKFKARDGVQIQGYYTKAKDRKNAPLLVIPHGGPHGVRDYWDFDSEVQLLAQKGFNVLQLNFRGSGGYGEAFQALGYKQWGGSMIDDIVDGTHYVIKAYELNANRVCIYGASYGAFAALMSTAKAPELFRCAIAYVGVFDLEMMYKKGDILVSNVGQGYLEKVIGKETQQLQINSPVHNAEKITAKVLLVAADEDRRAPIEQSEAMRAALIKAGNTPEWLEFGRAGHGVYAEKDRVKLYQKILSFLEESLSDAEWIAAK